MGKADFKRGKAKVNPWAWTKKARKHQVKAAGAKSAARQEGNNGWFHCLNCSAAVIHGRDAFNSHLRECLQPAVVDR